MTQHTEESRAARTAVIRKYWDVLMSGDMATFRSLLAPDAVIHYPGQNHMSGDYTTTDEIVELYRRLTEFVQQGTFEGEVLDITTGDVYTSVVIRYDITTPLRVLHGRAIGLFILDDDLRIQEYWLHEWNQNMINWVFRSSRWLGWIPRVFSRKKGSRR
ncbi:hypothetical protein GCM10022200_04360 [Microbacterium awajiense]|uniref:SnoaL-like domain-containing protein n=1 Tax=Microbacterium awajiense TaxID=415214 RepID=A0ABP7A553_9MICO